MFCQYNQLTVVLTLQVLLGLASKRLHQLVFVDVTLSNATVSLQCVGNGYFVYLRGEVQHQNSLTFVHHKFDFHVPPNFPGFLFRLAVQFIVKDNTTFFYM